MLLTLMFLFGLGREAEVARIQAHIAGAEAQLRAADTSALTDDQRARRAEVIDELVRYRVRGEFPRNLDFAERTPYFIDDRGVRCAMAHLIERFGGAELVARVAATANNAYVPELAADPELRAWLDAHGMTVAEAARVQPGYEAEVGAFCGGVYWCAEEDLCLPALDHPEERSYCSARCDPAGDACPIGMQGVQMECREIDAELRCVYPDQTPGLTGWACDLDTWWDGYPGADGPEPYCQRACVGDRITGIGSCIDECPRDLCEQGLDCVDWYSPDDEPDCMAPIAGPGCSAGGGSPALASLALLLLLRRRRRRRVGARDRGCQAPRVPGTDG